MSKMTLPMKMVMVPVDISGVAIASVIETLTEAAAGLTNATLEIEYADDYLNIEIQGLREKTDEDILAEMAQEAATRKARLNHIARTIKEWAKDENTLRAMKSAVEEMGE